MNARAPFIYALAAAAAAWWLLRTQSGTAARGYAMKNFAKVRELLVREEGQVNYAYKDSVGKWTIGVGHLILPNEQHLLAYTKANPAPQAVIDELLRKDAADAARAVDALGVPLTANQHAALVSLAFNIGAGAFARSTVAARLKAGDLDGAGQAMLMWKNAGGKPILLPRRERELALFRVPSGPVYA